jgi:hypothetical protein
MKKLKTLITALTIVMITSCQEKSKSTINREIDGSNIEQGPLVHSSNEEPIKQKEEIDLKKDDYKLIVNKTTNEGNHESSYDLDRIIVTNSVKTPNILLVNKSNDYQKFFIVDKKSNDDGSAEYTTTLLLDGIQHVFYFTFFHRADGTYSATAHSFELGLVISYNIIDIKINDSCGE